MGFKIPSINQLITLSIALFVLFFVLRMLPDSVKSFFRV